MGAKVPGIEWGRCVKGGAMVGAGHWEVGGNADGCRSEEAWEGVGGGWCSSEGTQHIMEAGGEELWECSTSLEGRRGHAER